MKLYTSYNFLILPARFAYAFSLSTNTGMFNNLGKGAKSTVGDTAGKST